MGSKLIVCGRGLEVIEKDCVASGAIPLCALIVPVYVAPGRGRYPETVPFDCRVKPGGSAPELTAKIGGGNPLAVTV
jgi:hypothetical protein